MHILQNTESKSLENKMEEINTKYALFYVFKIIFSIIDLHCSVSFCYSANFYFCYSAN